ncbi:MAG: phosphoenolpyruvate--protein phosphotransferase [Sphaerochaetaceae bacterium]
MRIMKGIAASGGIGFGRAFTYIHEKLVVPHVVIGPQQVEAEKNRFHKTLKKVADELQHLNGSSEKEDHKKILETQLLMLSDPEFIAAVEKKIGGDHICVEWAVKSVVSHHIAQLQAAEDYMLRERSTDLYDIGWRVIRKALGKKEMELDAKGEDIVLVADTLLPSEALSLHRMQVKAIVLNVGGRTSHVSILARALQIPTVVGLATITDEVQPNDEIIVDGNRGEVIVRPTSSSVEKMKKRYEKWVAHEQSLQDLVGLPTVTLDGHTICLKANIETIDEIETVVQSGAAGIGLFRSEFLFLKPGGASEQEQFEAYKHVLRQMEGIGSVTIRTIDVGGDKVIPGMEELGEENPILGWRAVRFCLARQDIFKTQLRALLRASAYGKLKIMFPMISGPEELESVLEVLEHVKEECRTSGVPFDEEIRIGTMIEVPSAALCADLLAPKADFFSIGTNDLIQYTIAVDRGNEKIAYLYQPLHPGVLRLLKMVVDKAHKGGIPVAICGEMAGDPLFTVLLLGLGIDELSMSPQSLLEIKSIIRSISLADAQKLAKKVMEMDSYVTINAYVKEWMHETFADIYPA